MKRVYVWTLPSRLFHWLFVSLIVGGWISSLEARWLSYHAAIGSAAAVLLLFRLVWGVMGPKYSRFGDFEFRFDAVKSYLQSLLWRPHSYIGHNPAASYVMVGILLSVALAVVSGMAVYGIQENRGVLAVFHAGWFRDMELFAQIHEGVVNLLWVLIALHVVGVLADRCFHVRERTFLSMIDGYKGVDGENALLSQGQKTVAFIGIGGSAVVLIYAIAVPGNPLVAAHTQTVHYEKTNPVFANECGSCHTLYPPELLPKRSWTKLMGGLENHFGDDASLDPADHALISAYLQEHSAETSTQEMSVKIRQSVQNRDIIAITETPFWKRTHRDISAAVFESGRVKSRANCKACHGDVEQGRIEDDAIQPIEKG